MDISGALNNTLDLRHEVSLGDDDVFYKSTKKRKTSRPHNLNLSSKKRKKVISSKISNSSIGSISKDSLRLKNKHLALEVQKAKIVLSELNRQYVALQQENQEAWVIVRRKRQEVNDVQNYINTEATNRIRENLKVVNGVVRDFMSGLFEDVMYKHIERETEENQSCDYEEREVFKNISVDHSLLDQPPTETTEPAEKAVEEKLSRKIRRSSFNYDARGPDYSKRLGSAVAQKSKERDTSASPSDGLHNDNNCEMNMSLPLSDDKEVFEAIPVMMLLPENNNNNFSDMDASVISNSSPSLSKYNKQNTPIVKSISQGFKPKDRFPSRKPNFSICGKKGSEFESDLKHSNKMPSITSRNSLSVKENNSTQVKKILLSSRDREKHFNVRDMFMPKPKTKSKSRSKPKVNLSKSESLTQTDAENKCIFDFDCESPFILSNKTKTVTTLDAASSDSPKTGRSKTKNLRDENDDCTFESPGKVKSKSRSKKQKYKDQDDDDDDKDFVIPLKMQISDGNESDVKSGLRSRSRCRIHKDLPKDVIDDSSNSGDKMKVESPEKPTSYMNRSRSKGRSISSSIMDNKTKESFSSSEIAKVENEVSGIHSNFSSKILVEGHSESRSRSKSKNDLKLMEPSTLYSVPMKVSSPDLPSKSRGRSRSRGRPKKENSNEAKTIDQTSKNRGRSRSRGREKDKLIVQSRAAQSSVKKIDSDLSDKGDENSRIEGTEKNAPDVYSIPMKTNSLVPKVSLERCGRSRSRGSPTLEGKIDFSEICSSPVSKERQGRSCSIGKPKKNDSTTKDNTDTYDIYSISTKTNSPDSKISLQRKGRSRSRGRSKEGSTTNVCDLYSLPLKTNSPESQVARERNGRSRSRGRPKKEGSSIQNNIDASLLLRIKSPESSHSEQSMKSRGRSQSRSRFKTEASTERKKSDTSEVYSIPLNIESPESKVTYSRSRSKGRQKKEDSGMESKRDVSELYSIPLKKSSPNMKQSEHGALRRGRSRSRGRPKKDSSTTDIISNQLDENITSSYKEPSSPCLSTLAMSRRQDQAKKNSPFTNKAISESGIELPFDRDSLGTEQLLKRQERSLSRRSKGQNLDSRKSRSKGRELKRTTDTCKSTLQSIGVSRGSMINQSAEPSCHQEHQNTSSTESRRRRSNYELSGPKQSEYNLESDEDELCQVFNFHDEKNNSPTSKNSSEKTIASKNNESCTLFKKNISPGVLDEPPIQILVEDTETIAINACKYERLSKKFDMVTVSSSKSKEMLNKDPLTGPTYSAIVKMNSPEKKNSSRRGRSQSRGRKNKTEKTSENFSLNSEVCEVYSVTAKTNSPNSSSTEPLHRCGRSRSKVRPADKVENNLDSPNPTRSSKASVQVVTDKENLSPDKSKYLNSPVSTGTPKSISSSLQTHNVSSNRKRKLEDNESDQWQENKKFKDKIDDKNITESSIKTSSTLKVNPWAAKAMKARSKSKKLSNVEKIVRQSLNVYEPKLSFDQSEKESDRNSLNEATRKSRRAAGGISYKEPSLGSKLRREDVIEKQKARLSGKVMVQ